MTIQIGFIIMGIVFAVAGILFIMTAIFAQKKNKPFFDNALPAEGTVIDVGIRQPRPFKKIRYSAPTYTQVTIAFTTNTNQLIQSDIDTNLTLFYSGQYKKGDKVSLLYNPEKPTEFIVTTSQAASMARFILLAIGIFLLLTGISMTMMINPFSLLQK